MIRTLSLVTVFFATALALPSMAQDAKTKIEDGAGSTSTMTDQVPQMKRSPEAIKEAGSNPAKALPATKAMSKAVPSMRPGDSGQSDDKSNSGATPAQ